MSRLGHLSEFRLSLLGFLPRKKAGWMMIVKKMHVFLAAVGEHATLGRRVDNDVLRMSQRGLRRVVHGR